MNESQKMKVYIVTDGEPTQFHFDKKEYAINTLLAFDNDIDPQTCIEVTNGQFAKLVMALQSQFGEVIYGRRGSTKPYLAIRSATVRTHGIEEK